MSCRGIFARHDLPRLLVLGVTEDNRHAQWLGRCPLRCSDRRGCPGGSRLRGGCAHGHRLGPLDPHSADQLRLRTRRASLGIAKAKGTSTSTRTSPGVCSVLEVAHAFFEQWPAKRMASPAVRQQSRPELSARVHDFVTHSWCIQSRGNVRSQGSKEPGYLLALTLTPVHLQAPQL